MSKFKVGQEVKIVTDSYGLRLHNVVTKVVKISGSLYILRPLNYGDLYFAEEHLEAVVPGASVSPDKVDAFRKATELLPDGLVEDRIQLAEWLMNNE